jgi:hypothetical protein
VQHLLTLEMDFFSQFPSMTDQVRRGGEAQASQEEKPPEKRTRAAKSKVRTGCITCKSRRVLSKGVPSSVYTVRSCLQVYIVKLWTLFIILNSIPLADTFEFLLFPIIHTAIFCHQRFLTRLSSALRPA